MNTTSKLTHAMRQELIKALSNDYNGLLRSTARNQYRQRENELRGELIDQLAAEKGAVEIREELKTTRAKVDELEEKLDQIGFDLNHDGSFHVSSGSPLWEVIEKRITDQIGSWQDIDARFDELRVEMMTADTPADAQKILQSARALIV